MNVTTMNPTNSTIIIVENDNNNNFHSILWTMLLFVIPGLLGLLVCLLLRRCIVKTICFGQDCEGQRSKVFVMNSHHHDDGRQQNSFTTSDLIVSGLEKQ
jgi:hypothetical protein